MKKSLSVLLILALALTLPAIALASPSEWSAYTHPDGIFSINYPADWTVADVDTLEDILANVSAGKIEGMDASMLEASRDLILDGSLTMFIAPGNDMNFNVQVQDVGQELTVPQLVEAVCPMMIEQFQAMFSDMEVLEPGNTMTAGDVEYAYVLISCQTNGEQALLSQTYAMRGATLAIITYTLVPERGLDLDQANAVTMQVASSFR